MGMRKHRNLLLLLSAHLDVSAPQKVWCRSHDTVQYGGSNDARRQSHKPINSMLLASVLNQAKVENGSER